MQKLMFQKRENRGMKKCAGLGIVVAMAVVLLAGCSWETGSDATSWSSAFNWVSFNGTYRGAAGGVLVSAYSLEPAVPATTGSVEVVTVNSEGQGSFSAGTTVFAGNLGHDNVVAGSVVISFYNNAGVVIRSVADSSGAASTNGSASGSGSLGESGTIQYVSGAWQANFNLNPVTENGYIVASYSYYRSIEGEPAQPAGNTQPGSSGRAIFSLSLVHQGQNLTLTDNNGARYTGTIGEMRSSSGYENTDITQVGTDEQDNDARYTYQESPLPPPNDTITATFACAGVSTAGYQVKIVGSLQGNVDVTGTVFANRRIDATWVEVGGKAGNVNGTTGNVTITPTVVSTNSPAGTNLSALAF
jgi:hypothetical protein